jgi:uncharacterized membrane protein (UPF0127 family)
LSQANSSKEQPQIRVDNVTRERTVVANCEIADNSWTRFKGLIGHAPLAEGEGLLIMPCSSIHSHFMGFPIDVLYVDKEQKVVGVDENLKPWRFGHFFKRVRFVVELPAGTAAATGTQVGDQLQVQGYEL